MELLLKDLLWKPQGSPELDIVSFDCRCLR